MATGFEGGGRYPKPTPPSKVIITVNLPPDMACDKAALKEAWERYVSRWRCSETELPLDDIGYEITVKVV